MNIKKPLLKRGFFVVEVFKLILAKTTNQFTLWQKFFAYLF